MESIRRYGFLTLVLFLPMIVLGDPAPSTDPLVESVKRGCETELREHCQSVTPGNGRQLACLYSFQDKLSGRCEYALYDASAQLQRTVAAVSYIGSECSDDMETHCSRTRPGEGRILECLKSHRKELNERCGKALDDVGVE
jgi:hypothetical protein